MAQCSALTTLLAKTVKLKKGVVLNPEFTILMTTK